MDDLSYKEQHPGGNPRVWEVGSVEKFWEWVGLWMGLRDDTHPWICDSCFASGTPNAVPLPAWSQARFRKKCLQVNDT